MSFVLTKGADDEDATEFAYVACAYACVATENQALSTRTFLQISCHFYNEHVTVLREVINLRVLISFLSRPIVSSHHSSFNYNVVQFLSFTLLVNKFCYPTNL